MLTRSWNHYRVFGIVVTCVGLILTMVLYSTLTNEMSSGSERHDENPIITCHSGDFTDTAFTREVKRNETVLIPDVSVLQKLSREEMSTLYHRYIENQQYLCKRKVRLGSIEDGGWDICDDDQFRPSKPCLAYSFGINNDFTFDDAVIDYYGCEVHSFDPSMGDKDYKRNDLSYFFNLGVSDQDETTDDGWQLRTFNSIRLQLGHSQLSIPIVKMDIEQYEWRVVPDMLKHTNLAGTSNFVIEFHLALSSPEQDRDVYLNALKLLRDIYEEGYRIFWTHGNKYCKFVSKCKKELRTNCHEVNFVRLKSG